MPVIFSWSAETTEDEWADTPRGWPPKPRPEDWPAKHRDALMAAFVAASFDPEVEMPTTWATENDGDSATWTLRARVKR